MNQVMVLAAGAGMRLREITRGEIPKVLVPFRNTTPLDITLNKLGNFDRIVVNAYTCWYILLQHMRINHPKAFVSVEPKLLGSGGAIKRALKWFDIGSKIVVINGDTLHNVSDYLTIPQVQQALQDSSYITILGAMISGKPDAYTVLGKEDDKYVVDAGIYVVAPQALADIYGNVFDIDAIYSDAVKYNLAKSVVVKDLIFWDTGTPKGLNTAIKKYHV